MDIHCRTKLLIFYRYYSSSSFTTNSGLFNLEAMKFRSIRTVQTAAGVLSVLHKGLGANSKFLPSRTIRYFIASKKTSIETVRLSIDKFLNDSHPLDRLLAVYLGCARRKHSPGNRRPAMSGGMLGLNYTKLLF